MFSDTVNVVIFASGSFSQNRIPDILRKDNFGNLADVIITHVESARTNEYTDISDNFTEGVITTTSALTSITTPGYDLEIYVSDGTTETGPRTVTVLITGEEMTPK